MQVRPTVMYIQKLDLAVWAFNLRKPQIDKHRNPVLSPWLQQYLPPTPQLAIGEGTRTHSHQKYHPNVRGKCVSFQPWVIKENIYFRTLGRDFAFYFGLNLSTQLTPSPGHSGTWSIDKYVCHNIAPRHTVERKKNFLVISQRWSYLLVCGSKRWREKRQPLTSTLPMIEISILGRSTCHRAFWPAVCRARSRPEAGRTHSRIKTAPLSSQNKTATNYLNV